MAGEDSEGAVNLFGQHHSRKLVRHRKRRKRYFLLRARANLLRKAFRIASEEHQLARSAVPQVAQPSRELLRRELFSGGSSSTIVAPGSIFNLRSAAGEPSRNSVT